MTAAIRAFVPDDLTGVERLVARTLGEFGFGAHAEAASRDLADAAARYAGPRAGLWVAEEEGAIVGMVAIRPKEGATCELKRLYVRADCRGAGLGDRLYLHAEAFARAAGYTRIWLDSSRRFQKAHRLYLRHGFTKVASLDNAWEDDVFEKPLTPPPAGPALA